MQDKFTVLQAFRAAFPNFQNKTPCTLFFIGGEWSSNGLFNHFFRSTLTNRFNRIKATKFDKYQLCFAIALSAFKTKIVISAVQICIITAF